MILSTEFSKTYLKWMMKHHMDLVPCKRFLFHVGSWHRQNVRSFLRTKKNLKHSFLKRSFRIHLRFRYTFRSWNWTCTNWGSSQWKNIVFVCLIGKQSLFTDWSASIRWMLITLRQRHEYKRLRARSANHQSLFESELTRFTCMINPHIFLLIIDEKFAMFQWLQSTVIDEIVNCNETLNIRDDLLIVMMFRQPK